MVICGIDAHVVKHHVGKRHDGQIRDGKHHVGKLHDGRHHDRKRHDGKRPDSTGIAAPRAPPRASREPGRSGLDKAAAQGSTGAASVA